MCYNNNVFDSVFSILEQAEQNTVQFAIMFRAIAMKNVKFTKNRIMAALSAVLLIAVMAPVQARAAESAELPDSEALEALPAADETESVVLQDSVGTEIAGTDLPAGETADTAVMDPAAPQLNVADTKEVYDALAAIYADQANVPRQGYTSMQSSKLLKDVRYRDILKGAYSRNAVAALLDHGYYRELYTELKDAGLLPDDYILPIESYAITRTGELMRYPLPQDAFQTCVIVTDSLYLQTYQLSQIADYHDFVEYDSYVAELESFEQDYVMKAEWDEETLTAYASLH